jgi:hypothetical protein
MAVLILFLNCYALISSDRLFIKVSYMSIFSFSSKAFEHAARWSLNLRRGAFSGFGSSPGYCSGGLGFASCWSSFERMPWVRSLRLYIDIKIIYWGRAEPINSWLLAGGDPVGAVDGQWEGTGAYHSYYFFVSGFTEKGSPPGQTTLLSPETQE